MGMAKCEIHGLSHGITICPHLADAIDENASKHAEVVFDDWITPSLVCDRCASIINASRVKGKEPLIGFDHLLDEPLVPFCFECVKDWFEEQTGENLSARIAGARPPSRESG